MQSDKAAPCSPHPPLTLQQQQWVLVLTISLTHQWCNCTTQMSTQHWQCNAGDNVMMTQIQHLLSPMSILKGTSSKYALYILSFIPIFLLSLCHSSWSSSVLTHTPTSSITSLSTSKTTLLWLSLPLCLTLLPSQSFVSLSRKFSVLPMTLFSQTDSGTA